MNHDEGGCGGCGKTSTIAFDCIPVKSQKEQYALQRTSNIISLSGCPRRYDCWTWRCGGKCSGWWLCAGVKSKGKEAQA